MRNPKDYPKFLDSLKGGNIDQAFSFLERILRTDIFLKTDADTKELLKTFNKNLTIEQKAYIVAQFMDVIFKDKNSISQVLSSNLLWNDREK